MNLREIREEAWDYADDRSENEEDRLWKPEEMDRYVNRIYRDIARETKCIEDFSTPEVCQIAITPIAPASQVTGTLDYQYVNNGSSPLYGKTFASNTFLLHKSILEICDARLLNGQVRLNHRFAKKWKKSPTWDQRIGLPTEYATDLKNGYLAVNYRAETADIVLLSVKRLPLTPLRSSGDVPEIPISYHDAFLDGILAEMYSKQDSQTYEKGRAEKHKEQYLERLDDIKRIESNSRPIPINSPLGACL